MNERTDDALPVDHDHLDAAAYTYLYHMNGGSNVIRDPFWGNEKNWKTLLTWRFDEHEYLHRQGCLKKDHIC